MTIETPYPTFEIIHGNNLNRLQTYIDFEESHIRQIEIFSNEVFLNEDSNDEKEPEGTICKSFVQENCFLKMTHFTRLNIVDLFREMEECAINCPRRGRKPNISDMDAFLDYLVLFKTGMDNETLATFFLNHNKFINSSI